MSKNVLVVLRHAKSLAIVEAYAHENKFDTISVAMDPVELPADMPKAIMNVLKNIASSDAIALGTKVYNDIKDGPSHLMDFLYLLKQGGAGDKPICLTNLGTFSDEEKQQLAATGLNLSWVEEDNLGKNGMEKFGPLIKTALKII